MPERVEAPDITRSPEEFTRLIRDELFRFIRLLVNKQYEELDEAYDLAPLFARSAPDCKSKDVELEKLMQSFYETRGWIRLDPAARAKDLTRVEISDDRQRWTVEQMIVDSENLNDWSLLIEVDLPASRSKGSPVLKLVALGDASENKLTIRVS